MLHEHSFGRLLEGQGFPQLLSSLHGSAEGQQVLKMLSYDLIRAEPGMSWKGWVCMLQIWGGSDMASWTCSPVGIRALRAQLWGTISKAKLGSGITGPYGPGQAASYGKERKNPDAWL